MSNPPALVARTVTGGVPKSGEAQLTSPVVLPIVMPSGAASSDQVIGAVPLAVAW